MALGRQVHDETGLRLGEGRLHGGGIGDIGLQETVLVGAVGGAEIETVAGVGEGVDVADAFSFGQQLPHQRRADEAGAAGDEGAHDARLQS